MNKSWVNDAQYLHPSKASSRRPRLRCRGMFWPVIIILSFFQTPSGSQVPLLPPPRGGGENASLKPAQQGDKWGYVDLAEKFRIPVQFDSADSFSEGVAAVELNKRFGYIDTDGHFVIQPKYFRAGPFMEGFAWVVTRKP